MSRKHGEVLRAFAARVRDENLAAASPEPESPIAAWHDGDEGRFARTGVVENCIADGYAPRGFGVVDFSIIRVGPTYHLFHIAHVRDNSYNAPGHTSWLGHATSDDLDTWVTHPPCLQTNPVNNYEASHVWAPFVLPIDGGHLMFYTGVSPETSQTLCAAKSVHRDLMVWKRSESNPIIPLTGFDWHWRNFAGHTRNARDPHVVRVEDHYLLAYTAMHRDRCGAVGGLVSTDLEQWEDIGPLLYRRSGGAEGLPESVNIQPMPDGKWALIPSLEPGLAYYLSDSPYGWHDSRPTPIACDNVNRKTVYALEVLDRDDERMEWLVAYFDAPAYRLRVGTMDCSKHPWTIRQAESISDVERWLIA